MSVTFTEPTPTPSPTAPMNRPKTGIFSFEARGKRFFAALRIALRDLGRGPAASISTLSPVSADRL